MYYIIYIFIHFPRTCKPISNSKLLNWCKCQGCIKKERNNNNGRKTWYYKAYWKRWSADKHEQGIRLMMVNIWYHLERQSAYTRLCLSFCPKISRNRPLLNTNSNRCFKSSSLFTTSFSISYVKSAFFFNNSNPVCKTRSKL